MKPYMGAFIFVLLTFATTHECIGNQEQTTLIRRLVWEVATRSLDPSAAGPVDQFNGLLATHGIKRDSVRPILIDYANGRNLPEDYPDIVSDFAVRVLVDWRSRDIVPMLVNLAMTCIDLNDKVARNARNGALARLMSIGGAEALDVARDVVNRPDEYHSLERYYVYENIASHLAAVDPSPEDEWFHSEAAAFLDSIVEVEPDPASVEVIDRALAVYSDEYRNSKRRMHILEEHKDTSLPYQRHYIRETLSELQSSTERRDGK